MPAHAMTKCVLRCSFGTTPTVLNTLPLPGKPTVLRQPVALVTDTTPINITTFGLCQSPANPQVIALTSAALGVFTPAPCIPVIPPIPGWVPGSLVARYNGIAVATVADKAMCAFAGIVSVATSFNPVVKV